MSHAPATAHRVDEIDALRGVAAVAVMLFHYTTRIGEIGVVPIVVEPWRVTAPLV